MLHQKCINCLYPRTQVIRFPIPANKVKWSETFEDYVPANYTNPKVLTAAWADPDIKDPLFSPKFNEMDGNVDRRSFTGKYHVLNGIPLNIIGRTGISGRGHLGRWGPNHAADPIVTRWKRDTENAILKHKQSGKSILQFVAILRRDCGEWAIPGGMVDPGEQVSETLKREFGEEALNFKGIDLKARDELERKIKENFDNGIEVYRGYVDDPRNTDNAWMETTAVHFHDAVGDSLGAVHLTAGDDAARAQWRDVDGADRLYASHRHFLRLLSERLDAHW